MKFSDEELHIISNALRVAAEEFDRIASNDCGRNKPLSEQFERQAHEAAQLYDRITEEAGIQS